MCGIAGALAREPDGRAPEGAVELAAAAMVHRGPDGFGFFHHGPVALAHRRLSIIDLSDAGRQPMTNEDGQIAIVVNGEIYNHAELRADLEAKGHRFRSASDSEVIAHLYEEVGERTPEFLRGMFAFAVWDARSATLLLARDRFGEKPLYYCDRADGFVFASEIAALVADPRTPTDVSLEALDSYLALQYVPAPNTIYESVNKLPPGHTLQIRCGQRPVVRRYYTARFAPELAGIGEEEAARRVRATVEEAVRSRLMSDVPLGAFLSGGIDSSIVVACMARATGRQVKTFSVGFSEGGRADNELPFARLMAERYHTEHHELVVDPDMVGLLPSIVRHHGEPFADTSAVPTRYLCEMTRRHVTVALSGDAGDEAFGGYRRYVWAHVAELLRRLPGPLPAVVAAAMGVAPGGKARWLREYGARMGDDQATRYLRFVCHFSAAEKADIYTPELRARFARDRDRGGVRGAARRQRGDRHGQPAAGSGRRHLPARRHPGQGRHRQHDAQPGGARAAGRPPRRRAGRGAARPAQAARADRQIHPQARVRRSGAGGDRQPEEEGVRAADGALAGGAAARLRARHVAVAGGARPRVLRPGRGRGAARSPPRGRGPRRAAVEPDRARDLAPRDGRRARGVRRRRARTRARDRGRCRRVRAVFFVQGTDVPAARVRGFAVARALEARGVTVSVRVPRPSVYGDTRLPWPLNRPRPLYVPLGALARVPQMADLRPDDVVIFQRPMTELPTTLFERWAARGRQSIFDFDDAIYERRGVRGKFRRIVALADRVVAGNRHLAAATEAPAKTVIIPTAIDTDRFVAQPSRPARGRDVVVGWTGLSGNYRQLAHAAAGIARALDADRAPGSSRSPIGRRRSRSRRCARSSCPGARRPRSMTWRASTSA